MAKFTRRQFIAGSAAAASYSVLVNARGAERIDPNAPLPYGDALGGFDTLAPPEAKRGGNRFEPNMVVKGIDCDLLVAGGGMSGVCAALAAARRGARVLLVQDRSRLGGNASSEIKMHIVGADRHGGNAGWREGGIIEELRLDDAVNNSHRAWELWDLMLYDKCMREPNLTLLLDSVLYGATVEDGAITEAQVRCDKTEHLYRVRAKLFMDCTGDSRLALEAGADFRIGREDKLEFAESLGLDNAEKTTQGSSILFTSRKHDAPMPYVPPPWARKITPNHLKFRGVGSWEYGYWWIELGGMYDTIRDNERLRFELLSIVLGVWDYIKNSGNHPSSANWALQTVGMIPGKRESRRIMGDHILTQNDLEGVWATFRDGVCIGGWAMDEHPAEGFDAPDKGPFTPTHIPGPYNIPLGSLYSRNIKNLLMAGRNISASHVAFTSARVMATCSVEGQAAGTAAAFCLEKDLLPAALRSDHKLVAELQQRLLRDDQTIRNVTNADPADHARHARVTASDHLDEAPPANILTGTTRDKPGEWKNRWGASVKDGQKPWLQLAWDRPRELREVQITFDSGFHRELTLSASDGTTRRQVRGPQPETVREYSLEGIDGTGNTIVLAEVTSNHQRLRRHAFDPVSLKAVRLVVNATNGSDTARVYEVRCY